MTWLIFSKYLTAGHVTVTGRSQPCESVRLPLACNSCVIVGLSLPPSGESVSVSSSPTHRGCHRNSFGLSHLGYLTVLRSFGDCTSLFWQPNLMNFISVMAWLSEWAQNHMSCIFSHFVFSNGLHLGCIYSHTVAFIWSFPLCYYTLCKIHGVCDNTHSLYFILTTNRTLRVEH